MHQTLCVKKVLLTRGYLLKNLFSNSTVMKNSAKFNVDVCCWEPRTLLSISYVPLITSYFESSVFYFFVFLCFSLFLTVY